MTKLLRFRDQLIKMGFALEANALDILPLEMIDHILKFYFGNTNKDLQPETVKLISEDTLEKQIDSAAHARGNLSYNSANDTEKARDLPKGGTGTVCFSLHLRIARRL